MGLALPLNQCSQGLRRISATSPSEASETFSSVVRRLDVVHLGYYSWSTSKDRVARYTKDTSVDSLLQELLALMSQAKVYDWDTLRKAYVSGDVDLIALARETTRLESSPAYISLKKRAAKEGWTNLRKEYQRNVTVVSAANPTVQQVAAQTEQYIDAAGAIARHINLAKSLETHYLEYMAKLQRDVENMNFSGITPFQLSLIYQRMATVAATSADMERKALGISDPTVKAEIENKFVVALPPLAASVDDWTRSVSSSTQPLE